MVENEISTQLAVQLTGVEKRIIKLLSQGVKNKEVAQAVGVPIDQVVALVERQEIKEIVAKAQFEAVESRNDLDASYDKLESKVADYLNRSISMLVAKPAELARVLQIVNKLERRGTGSNAERKEAGQTVRLNIPSVLVQHFQVNIDNQVISAGGQDLTTLPSSQLEVIIQEKEYERIEARRNTIRRDSDLETKDI
ncbi:MAG TPA: hypothetical protein VEQ18_05645 [Candidatus Nitrosocosmicus sp.]|nr:hypothetical protein [Candidatus Nitrosocosmicus sp.]